MRYEAVLLRAVSWNGAMRPSTNAVLLLTGRPGVGKTTVIRKVVEALPQERLGGFYTEEVREHGRRRGFRAVTFDGWVGRYRVIVSRTN